MCKNWNFLHFQLARVTLYAGIGAAEVQKLDVFAILAARATLCGDRPHCADLRTSARVGLTQGLMLTIDCKGPFNAVASADEQGDDDDHEDDDKDEDCDDH